MSRRDLFLTIRTEGGLLPADLLQRLTEAQGPKGLEGLTPEAYHLSGEKLSEAISASYARLRAAWSAFRTARVLLPPGDPATTVTRERWLLPLFRELDYGRLPARRAIEVEGKSYPISHSWEDRVPIHLVGAGVDLDRAQKGVTGAARQSPYGLLQELLNRSAAHLWGFVSNGLVLRVLRDNLSLTRQAYVEFDLQALMEGEVYPDFILLWLLCHQSRVEAEKPHECWLERWSQQARVQGTRALEKLRTGVESAITALGAGFLRHPRSQGLKEALRSGALSPMDYYRQLLRLVYRLIFVLVAEDRGVLLDPQADAETRARFSDHYSMARLRRLAERRAGSAHCDLWRQLRLVIDALGRPEGCAPLGLTGLGGALFADKATPDLDRCDLTNQALLDALRALCFTAEGKVRRVVSYANLGAEELGSIYEALLEQHPVIKLDLGAFELGTAAGHERKTTGSYYTPSSLVSCLLDTALDPVLREARAQKDPEAALLNLKVCDPACGSGHFLIAAAHRIARQVAAVRTREEEPPPNAVRAALHEVIARCLYGVDINEMAVELCKVSLWMEAMEPGKPLSFLDHHIRCGNSLLGATPALLRKGLPDEAFDAIEGDDKKVCTALRKRNKKERENPNQTAWSFTSAVGGGELGDALRGLDRIGETGVIAVREKEDAYARLRESAAHQRAKLLADAYCAAFVIRKDAEAVAADRVLTYGTLQRLSGGPELVPVPLRAEIDRLARQYRFLHYHVEFPDVFGDYEDLLRGFDVVLGNPPWERVKLQEQEFFAMRSEEIARVTNASARKKLIAALPLTDKTLWEDWCAASREAEGQSQFARQSGRFPLCGKGDVNTYTLFAEHNRALISPRGRAGFIVPTGIATDDTTKDYFGALLSDKQLDCLYDFENTASAGFFRGVGHGNVKFCLLTIGHVNFERPSFVFYAHEVSDISDPIRRYQLSAAEIATLNPNTRTCSIFRTRRDADINLTIYRRSGVLWQGEADSGNPWCVGFMRMLDMTNDSGLFQTHSALESCGHYLIGNRFHGSSGIHLPLIEAKMVSHFDHRFGDYRDRPEGVGGVVLPAIRPDQMADPSYEPLPQYWVRREEVDQRLHGRWKSEWLLGWRDITRAVDQRTVFAALIPRVAVGNNLPLMTPLVPTSSIVSLYANLCSFALDYAARQKAGGTHLNYFIVKQLPVLPPATYEVAAPWAPGVVLRDWILPRVLELTYTAWDLEPFARDCGYDGPPYRWDPARRFLLRCELDAAFFHLYGISRDDAAYILDTFPIVRKNDEKAHGEYRTQRVILEVYDALAVAAASGQPYATRLDPPPADPRVAHPPRGKILPFRRVDPRPEDRGRTAVPLYTLRIAAGAFATPQVAEPDGWVEPRTSTPLRPGMFVAQVSGRSMEPRVPDGAYALFTQPVSPPYEGRILLVEHRRIQDPDTDGSYTLKRFRRTPGAVVLDSENPAFTPIELTETEGTDLRIIAELVEVLNA